MKKIIILIAVIAFAGSVSAQVFTTGRTLKYNDQIFRFGINPMMTFPGNNFDMFSYAELGIADGIDFMIDYGYKRVGTNYLGTAVKLQIFEKGLPLAFSTGAHYTSNLGLDEQLNITIPFGEGFRLYCGPDLNIEFAKPISFIMTAYGGFEINLNKSFCLLIEADYCFKSGATIIGTGLNIYL